MNTRPSAERPRRRGWRWLVAGAALAVMPKCLLCAAAYLGLGAALGLGGPEICGAAPDSPDWPAAWASGLGAAGALAATGGWIAFRRRRSA